MQIFMKLFSIKVIRLAAAVQLSKLWCFGVLTLRPPGSPDVRAKVESRNSVRPNLVLGLRCTNSRLPFVAASGLTSAKASVSRKQVCRFKITYKFKNFRGENCEKQHENLYIIQRLVQYKARLI